MTLAPDDSAWNVTHRKDSDGKWRSSFMFVDMEYDGFMVDMYLEGGEIQVNFKSDGSCYLMFNQELMELFADCVEIARYELEELECNERANK